MNKDTAQSAMAEMLACVLGKAAWDAYKEAVGGKAFNGDPLPTWDEMTKDESKSKLVFAWKAAALAATTTFTELQA